MNRLNQKRLTSVGFYLALIMLAAISASSYWHIRHLIHSNELAARSQKVHEEFDHVLVNLLDIESGQRGCVLAGDLCFLEPSQHALDNIPIELKVLRELTGDQPQTQRLLDAVEPLIAQKVALLQKRISWLEKGDREAAIRSIRSGEGLRLMQNIRTVITAIDAEEDRLLAVRQAAAQASNRNALLTLLIGTFISLGLLLLIFYCLKREITRRRRTEEKLRRSEEEFRAVVNNMPTVVFKGYLDGSVDFFEDKVETLTGYPRGDFDSRGRKWTDLILVEDKGIAKQVFIKALKNFGSYVREYRISTKEGKVIWIQERSQITFDQEGRAGSVSGVFFDITARKRGEEAVRKSEKKYRNLFDNAVEGVFQSTPEGRFLTVNPAFARMLGYASPQEMITEVTNIGQQLWVHPEMREEMKRLLLEHSSVYDYEILYRRRDGTPMWFSENIRVARGADGQEFYEGFMVDINDRKRVEQDLRASEEKYRMVADYNYDWEYWLAPDGNFIYVSPSCERITGYRAEEFYADPRLMESLTHPDDRLLLAGHFQEDLQETFDPKDIEYCIITQDGQERWLSHCCQPVYSADGQWLGRRASNRDITERKLAEEAFQSLVNQAPIGIFTVQKGKFSLVNPGFQEITGYHEKELIGLNSLDIVAPDFREVVRKNAVQRLKGRSSSPYEFQIITKDGQAKWIMESITSIRQEGERLSLGYFMDVSARKRVEEELKESEQKFRDIFNNAIDGILLVDIETKKFSFANPMIAEMLGYNAEEIKNLTVMDIYPPEHLPYVMEQFQQQIERKITLARELQVKRKDGSVFFVDINAFPVTILGKTYLAGFFRDITDRQRAEEALAESYVRIKVTLEKTVGTLAMTVEKRDPYTAGHQLKVAQLAGAIASQMGVPEGLIEGLRLAALIHDVGKINVPAEILSKPGKLSEIEMNLIKIHPQIGHDILKGIDFPWPIALMVLQHHERLDGSGYPHGLAADDIIMEARIVAVADVVEAMSSYRPYRPALGIDKALEEITRNKGTLYDAEVVEACVKLFTEKEFRFQT